MLMSKENIFHFLKKLGLSNFMQLKIGYLLHVIANVVTKRQRKFSNLSLCTNNEFYGHEYWLKKYSGYKKNIYGVIEHGLYFGRNSKVVGNPLEYELPAIITYGDYRKEVLVNKYPKKNIIKIGPRIAYAPRDDAYYDEITGFLKGNKKLLTIFPAHSLSTIKAVYDVDKLMKEARRIAEKYNIDNIMVCLPYGDIVNGNAEVFSSLGLKVLSAGKDAISFLPRLKAIIDASTISLSNSLGTNLGYCIYLGCQQILIPQSIVRQGKESAIENEDYGESIKSRYIKESAEFASYFNEEVGLEISPKQYDFCDYYFGFRYVREPLELRAILNSLHKNRN